MLYEIILYRMAISSSAYFWEYCISFADQDPRAKKILVGLDPYSKSIHMGGGDGERRGHR